jgi:glycosyltransferase involved in cell wall biosynthesis
MRICLLSFDVAGPIRNGGIGTAFTALAEQLAADGHEVTIAFPSAGSETVPLAAWVEDYAARGIRFEPLFLRGSWIIQALQAYRWLEARAFDVVHYHEWRGLGFFAAMARHCGLGLQRTALVCQLHSPTGWHRRFSDGFSTSELDAEISFMERRSAELADLVFSPSRYLLDWVRAEGWRLPEAVLSHPNLLPRRFRIAEPDPAPRPMGEPVEELVFFGRLEERKGLELFCAAVSRLARTGPLPARVSFLGKVGEVGGDGALDWLVRRTADWPVPWQVRNDLDVLGARDFLAQPGRLAVIASVAENSPYTVLECIAAGTPFVAAEVGGVAELVEPADRGSALFERSAAALAERLGAALREGVRPARPAVPFARNLALWRGMQERAAAVAVRPPGPRAEPLVSVCVATFNRPVLLAETLASLEAQDYPALEVVVADDCSTDPAARAFLDAVEPRLAARGWRLLRLPENGYLGAARNAAVAAARGDYVLFMDDDNVACPEMVRRYVTAALATGADILTCQVHPFVGDGPGPAVAPPGPPPGPAGWMPLDDWIPLGGPVALGLLKNCFGDAGFLIRRARFEALGGFSTERTGFEDWELLLRAALDGVEILCVPEVLYHYRVNPRAMLRGMSPAEAYRSHARVARAWKGRESEPAIREALRLAMEMRVAPRYRRGPEVDQATANGAAAFREAARRLRDGAGLAAARETAALLLEQACRLQPGDAALWLEALGAGGAPDMPASPLPGLFRPEHLPLGRRAARALRAAGREAEAAVLEDALAGLPL